MLEQGWEDRGDHKIDDVTDKELIEYMMGFDIQLTVPRSMLGGKKDGMVFVVTHHETNRRGQMVAHLKFTADQNISF